jgi:hypothetical protein
VRFLRLVSKISKESFHGLYIIFPYIIKIAFNLTQPSFQAAPVRRHRSGGDGRQVTGRRVWQGEALHHKSSPFPRTAFM